LLEIEKWSLMKAMSARNLVGNRKVVTHEGYK
jgi:hypothetical protein